MKNQIRSQVKNSKTRSIFGIEAYSVNRISEYIYDINSDYNNCFSIYETTIFCLFKIPVYKIAREHDIKKYFLFGVKIKSISMAEIFYERNFKQINEDYDDAYILQAASGEQFLWLAYASRTHVAKNKSIKPLLIGSRDTIADLVKMYLPEATYIVNKKCRGFDTEKSYLEYSNHKFFVTKNLAKSSVYLTFNSSCLRDEYLSLKFWELCGIHKDEIQLPKAIISNESKISLDQKIKQLNINFEKFIILAPEANSFLKPPAIFWETVAQKFKDMGVDVFLNFINDNNFISGCKIPSEPLTYSEIYELALKAKAIVSLRSGFTETMLPTLTPIIVIQTLQLNIMYKQFENSTIPTTADSFSLFAIPFVKKENVRDVWYYDYGTSNEASDAVLSCYGEMIKNRASMKEG